MVLSTGRSWHGTRDLVDLLGLPGGPVVCSNGAVIVSYPPEEIVKAITFDPREVIAKVEEFAPGTLIAVEEIGRGYRLNDHFPGGDLTGEMIIEDVEQLSARPVTRVILRDPTRSDTDFIALAQHLGPARGDLLRRLERLAGHRSAGGEQGHRAGRGRRGARHPGRGRAGLR